MGDIGYGNPGLKRFIFLIKKGRIMRIPIYQVDAFAERLFKGNPAAICTLDRRLPDALMQSIAAENNLPETAFLTASNDRYDIRWFTPKVEIDLCGHATLATAFIVFTFLKPGLNSLTFNSKSGPLTINRFGDMLTMDFPSRPALPVPCPEGLAQALGRPPRETLLSRDLLAVFDNEEEIRSLKPDMAGLMAVKEAFGVIVSAPGRKADFVSRFFAPNEGIPEDPVTGSAHCTLVPYWAGRLNKTRFLARQVSERGGELYCELKNNRVLMSGRAFLYMKGEIEVADL